AVVEDSAAELLRSAADRHVVEREIAGALHGEEAKAELADDLCAVAGDRDVAGDRGQAVFTVIFAKALRHLDRAERRQIDNIRARAGAAVGMRGGVVVRVDDRLDKGAEPVAVFDSGSKSIDGNRRGGRGALRERDQDSRTGGGSCELRFPRRRGARQPPQQRAPGTARQALKVAVGRGKAREQLSAGYGKRISDRGLVNKSADFRIPRGENRFVGGKGVRTEVIHGASSHSGPCRGDQVVFETR